MGDGMTWVALALSVGALWFAFAARRRLLRAEREARRLSDRLGYTENYVAWLDRELNALKNRASSVAAPAASAVAAEPSTELASLAESSAERAPPEPAEADELAPNAAAAESAEAAADQLDAANEGNPPPPPSPSPEPPFSPAAPFDWENLIGVRLFAWLGGGTLFLGAALFLHYSIEQNLISPALRVAIGLVVGAGALFGGDQLRRRTRMAAEAISGAGVAILYASLFAAHSLYHLLGSTPIFGGMVLVTITGGLMAVRRGAFLVAVLGLIGGMATPYLLSTGEDRPLSLLVYVLLLDAGVLVVARKRAWPVLALLGLLGSAVLCFGWATRYLDAARAPYALGAVAVVAALFGFAQLSPGAGSEQRRSALPKTIAVIAALAPFVAAFAIGELPSFDLAPSVLVGYLVIVSAGAWLASLRADAPALTPFAAGLSLLALTSRADGSLFPEHRSATLLCFTLVPLAYFVAWYLRRAKPDASSLRIAATIALCGAAPIVLRVFQLESYSEPTLGAWLYVAVHAAGLAALGGLSGASWLTALGQTLSYVGILLLSDRLSDTRSTELAMPICLSGLVFWALPLLLPQFRRDRLGWLSAAASLPVHFLIIYWSAHTSWGAIPLGAIAVLCAALELFSFKLASEHNQGEPEEALTLRAVFGGEVLLFITAAVPILLANEWLTLSWSLEVAALAWLKRRVPHRGLVWASALLAVAVSLRLVANPALWDYHERTAIPILNFYLYTFGVPAAAFLVGARVLDADPDAARLHLTRLLRIAGTAFLFFLVNIEIADFYSEGSTITFHFSGAGLAQDLTYSLAWGLFGLGLMAIGLTLRQKAPRIGALLVLILTMGKVFLHDLWELGSLYRVTSIIGMAITLLLFSFLSQRFILRKETP
jgi:uncharacterized membrane protein